MNRVIFSRRAKADLLEIWSHLAEAGGLGLADRCVRLIYDRCQFLADSPGLGELQPRIGPEFRTFVVKKKYTIFFKRRTDGINVQRIAHGSRDWSNLF